MGGGADHGFGLEAGLLLVEIRQRLAVLFGLVGLDEMDGDAAETAAGEAGADVAGDRLGEFDHDVELLDAVVEVVRGGVLRFEHQAAECVEIACGKSLGAFFDAVDFADNVQCTQIGDFGQLVFRGLQLFGRDITQSLDAKDLGGEFTGFAAFVVFIRQIVFDHAVRDDESRSRGNRHVVDLQGAEVGIDQLVLFSHEGGDLIEQTGLRADVVVFGGLADESAVLPIEAQTRKFFDDKHKGHFQSSRGGHAGGQRDGAFESRFEGGNRVAALLELLNDAFDIVGPVALHGIVELVEIESLGGIDDEIVEFAGFSFDLRGGDGHGAIDGDGEDGAFVVVGMVAKNFKTAGGLCDDGGFYAEVVFKCVFHNAEC